MSSSTAALEPTFYDSHHAAYGQPNSRHDDISVVQPTFYDSHHAAYGQPNSINNALRDIYVKQIKASEEILQLCWRAIRAIKAQHPNGPEMDANIAPVIAIVRQQATIENEARASYEALPDWLSK